MARETRPDHRGIRFEQLHERADVVAPRRCAVAAHDVVHTAIVPEPAAPRLALKPDLEVSTEAQMRAAGLPVLRADAPRQESDDRGDYARHEHGVEHEHVALLLGARWPRVPRCPSLPSGPACVPLTVGPVFHPGRQPTDQRGQRPRHMTPRDNCLPPASAKTSSVGRLSDADA